jgi:predicted porin
MKLLRASLVAGLLATLPAWAVYAPIPEKDQGKDWTVSLRGGFMYDTNIFGSKLNPIDSGIETFAPKFSYNSSLTAQTFLSASYELDLDHFGNRPGDKTLDSHDFMVRLAHAFTKVTTIDVRDDYAIQRNPESLISGLPVNTDQSYKNNEFNAHFETRISEKAGLEVKARSLLYRYDNSNLASDLDRTENLFGISGDYAVQEDLKAVGEYRREIIDYRTAGGSKDKTSDFFLAGGDYVVARKLSSSARVGVESRHRDSQSDDTVPYAEVTAKYDYAQGSFLSAGYIYTLEETSNVQLYTDTQVNRFFVNVQHAVTSLITLSGSGTYEADQLQGRRGLRNADEKTTRFGVAVSYLPTKNWTVSLTGDYDHTASEDVSRGLTRNRIGASAIFAF